MDRPELHRPGLEGPDHHPPAPGEAPPVARAEHVVLGVALLGDEERPRKAAQGEPARAGAKGEGGVALEPQGLSWRPRGRRGEPRREVPPRAAQGRTELEPSVPGRARPDARAHGRLSDRTTTRTTWAFP